MSQLDVRRKLALLAVITIVLYGSGVFLDVVVNLNIEGAVPHPDLTAYRSRTQTILDGGLIYRDTHTETPPIINYILVPAELMGGGAHDWVWGLYFSLFAFLIAALLYLSLRRYDELKAFQVGFVTLITPFLLFESVTGEDESIMVFIFLLGVILMLYERKVPAAIAIAVGIWTKMFSILLLPIQFFRLSRWKDRVVLLLIVGVVTALVTSYFLLSSYDDFIFFLRFYFLGESGRESGGISMWHFLQSGGYGLPNELELAIVLGSLLLAYLFCHRKHLGVWQSVTLVVIVFIIVYPKMHTGYYILPCILLSIWGVENWRVLARIYLAFIPIMAAAGFAVQDGPTAIFDFPGNWIVGFFLVLAGTLLFVDAGRIASKVGPFIAEEVRTEAT